ncbi:hypothetical protein CR513_35667, partial [Mucuna pruriens]
MAQIFQILSQTNAAITAMANHSVVGHVQAGNTTSPPPHAVKDPPYEMPYDKWQSLEERLRAVEGGNRFGLEVVGLCLVLDVGFLANFKTPEFDKYKGSYYPKVHLAMYCRKMAAYIYNDKILIHCFQYSLTGAALS